MALIELRGARPLDLMPREFPRPDAPRTESEHDYIRYASGLIHAFVMHLERQGN